jgi:tRNA threonylcarbamoyl adenosine modification protein (Sua5/YciO/YrdC/YwlC family)
LLAATGRGRQSPPPVLVSGISQAKALVEVFPDAAIKLAETFWPGALTMIFRSQPSLDWDLGETKQTVALRVPDHKIALALLEEAGPLAVSSANLTGQPAATTCQQAFDYLKDSVQVFLDAGNSPKGEASTILDMTGLVDSYDQAGILSTKGKVKVVRRGALTEAKIRSVIGDLLESSAE